MEPLLLQRYRRDRRKLLDFILSSSAGFIKEIRTSSVGPTASLSNTDLDTLSVDYVLQCIQSGGVLDVSGAIKKYNDEAQYPVMMNSQLGDSYFLVSDPESAGSPPTRAPPPIVVNHANNHGLCPPYLGNNGFVDQNVSLSGDEYKLKYAATKQVSKPVKNLYLPSLGLPALHTGLSDDDLRESAYEILLTCMAFYGLEIYSFEDQKKDKNSRFLAGLKNKRDKKHLQPQSPERHAEVIDTIRVQMQISEAMDVCVRQRSMQFASRKACGQLDIPQISLGFLSGIFKNDFLYEKSYMQWKNRQVNTLEELFASANLIITDQQTIGTLLAKINNSEEWDSRMSTSEHTEVLEAIREVSLLLSSVPGRFGIQGETCYWTVGYHLNIRLYEKLLFGIFDILEEGQLMEGSDEILKLCKLTWSTLGITQKMHNAIYGWVLFQQYVLTEEETLLDHAILEVQKVLSAENNIGKDEEYINSLICSTDCNGTKKELGLVQAIFWSMSFWCDSKLQDYHLHFSQNTGCFESVMTMALVLRSYNSGEFKEKKLMTSDALSEFDAQYVRMYVQRSVEAAYRRVEDGIDLESQMERMNPLVLLASEVSLISEKEVTVFSPVLCGWYPDAARVSAILLHQFYGERLKPFLEEVSSLSEEVRVVLAAAGKLEQGLTRLFSTAFTENGPQPPSCLDLGHYKVGEICSPIILDWVIAQHTRILEWTGRTLNLEEWEPLSNQQKQSSSAVEVFRIIEETVDQFFGLGLPMDITHLQALLSIVFHTLDSYLVKVVSQLVDKHHLYPPVPPLTRYKEAVFPVMKKKVVEFVLLEEEVNGNLNNLTTSKLCVRLNTLQYIQKQMSILEDGIRKSWISATSSGNGRSSEEPPEASGTLLECSESVDELFVATFDSLRDTAADAIRRICDFIGARVVFWDLRDSFLFHLYHGSVGAARFDSILPHFDSVLNHICGFLDDILRDLVVASICRASLDGYVWVLLDGGPSCAFSDSDITMMEDDLNMLKDFFVADGEGLPRSLVENEAKFAHQILGLFSLQSESVIQMLMAASQHIPTGPESHEHGHRRLGDAHTLIRVLCHKKDREASKFLKTQYQLPASSEYNYDGPLKDSGSKPPMMADLLRTASLRWSDNGHNSFTSFKKKLQRATTEIR